MAASVKIETLEPSEISRTDWYTLHKISRKAFWYKLCERRTKAQIDYFTLSGNFNRFYESHLDPNIEVGKRFLPNQSYSDPKVVVAKEANGSYVGFGYSANNVSGNPLLRAYKMAGKTYKYNWIREVVVDSWAQRQGIGSLILNQLAELRPDQADVAYTLPSEIPFVHASIIKAGFELTGVEPSDIYGDEQAPVDVYRMERSA